MKNAVKLVGITKTYGFVPALKKISLQIEKGETVGLVGDNGAGKSTLIKIISLLIKPTAGQIELFGSTVKDNQYRFKRDIGTLLSHSFFYEDMTGRENLEFYLKMMGNWSSPEEIVEKAIKKYKLGFYIDRPIQELSTGMAKKLEILRISLPHLPPLLLLDEPFSGLDVENSAFMASLISNKASDTTIVIASHNFRMVAQLCDRVFPLIIFHRIKKEVIL